MARACHTPGGGEAAKIVARRFRASVPTRFHDAAAMPPRFRTVLLDLDGTLVDHFAAIHRCHAHAMTRLGLPAPTPAQVRAAVGGGLENAIRRLAGPEHVAAVLPLFRAHMEETMLDDVTALPGARELLAALRATGSQTAVLTNKHGDAARRICAHLGLAPLLDAVVGAGDTAWLKPDPRLTAHTLTLLGGDATDTLLIGDSPYDVQTARNTGLACWCVTTGTHTAEELRAAGAERVFPGLNELYVDPSDLASTPLS
jgi:phosphoglycolate phosphatase